MTIPAMAPALRPLLAVVAVVPAALLALEAGADAVMKGTVVVIEPVDVTVVATLVVGRMKAVLVAAAVAVVDTTEFRKELLRPLFTLLAAHWPAKAQYCPTAQQMVPQGLSCNEASHEIADMAGAAAAVVLLSAAKKEL